MLTSKHALAQNLAYACLRQPCLDGLAEQSAFRWISGQEAQEYSYGWLDEQSNRIANLISALGVQPGQGVSIFLPRSPELVTALFAAFKVQAVACVLFSTFGENALLDRLQDNRARVVVTKHSLLRKLVAILPDLPDLAFILVVDNDEDAGPQVLSLPRLLKDAPREFDFPPELPFDTPAFLQYTSGSTGKPKGALHVHGGLSSMQRSFQEVMGVQPGETYWCTADPAWITGLVYGLLAPFSLRVRQLQFGGGYHAERWLELLQEQQVAVWYTAPTALRMLMQEEEELFRRFDYSALRRIYSVGEPLNSEIYYWGKRVFGREIFDTFFQSETGSIMIANHPGLEVRPGSMGKPLSYIQPQILDTNGQSVPEGTHGRLHFHSGWDSMFQTYLNKPELYAEKFRDGWYFTGDLAWRDADGYYWYVSRADDVINTAGHLVGPFEVESALLEVDDVSDVAVIGVPDPLLHERIVAYLTLRRGVEWSRALELKCRIQVSNRVSSTAVPQEYHVVDKIPKNKSGKILRRVLRAWYEGKDPGDLSTMEE